MLRHFCSSDVLNTTQQQPHQLHLFLSFVDRPTDKSTAKQNHVHRSVHRYKTTGHTGLAAETSKLLALNTLFVCNKTKSEQGAVNKLHSQTMRHMGITTCNWVCFWSVAKHTLKTVKLWDYGIAVANCLTQSTCFRSDTKCTNSDWFLLDETCSPHKEFLFKPLIDWTEKVGSSVFETQEAAKTNKFKCQDICGIVTTIVLWNSHSLPVLSFETTFSKPWSIGISSNFQRIKTRHNLIFPWCIDVLFPTLSSSFHSFSIPRAIGDQAKG